MSFSREIVGETQIVLPNFSLHGHIRALTGDRIAVATTLLLGNYLSGNVTLGRPVSDRVVTAIRRYLSDDTLNFSDMTEVPLSVHSGSVELVVGIDGLDSLPSLTHTDRRRLAFRELESHSASGRIFTFDKLVVAANSWLFSSDVLNLQVGPMETSLAVPVLMAQDLSVSRITLPLELVKNRSEQEIGRVRELLEATELRLGVNDE